MRPWYRDISERWVLLLLVVVAAVLRFYDYASFSYGNDELSALFRTRYPGFRELISQGVLSDFHPAGVQVFLFYWVKIFGMSEASVRIPFVVAGILCIPVAYALGRQLFGRVSGLFFAASLVFLEYPLLYSQIARPYVTGLLLSLLMAWCWSMMVFPDDPHKPPSWRVVAGLALSAAGSAYDHYFCGLMAIIMGITGLFLIRKEAMSRYILGLVAGAALFTPHIPITLHHFSKGGVEEWLGKPGNQWFWEYLFQVFNGSWLLVILFFLVFLASLVLYARQQPFSRKHGILVLWFLLPFLVGFLYSRYINAVLQTSVLLFSTPFLLLLLSSWWKDHWNRISGLILALLLTGGLCDTVFLQKYYSRQHFGEFKRVAARVDAWQKKYGKKQVSGVIAVNNRWYIDFYLRQRGSGFDFLQYDNRGGKDLLDLCGILKKSTTPYFIGAWTKFTPDEVDEVIRLYYPCVLERIDYEGKSAVTLYSRASRPGEPCMADPCCYEVFNDFETDSLWGMKPGQLTPRFFKTADVGLVVPADMEYGPTYQRVLEQIPCWPFHTLRISIYALMPDPGGDVQIVADVFDVKGKSAGWASANLKNYLEPGKPGYAYFTYTLPPSCTGKEILKVYTWNHGKKIVLLDDMRIRFYKE